MAAQGWAGQGRVGNDSLQQDPEAADIGQCARTLVQTCSTCNVRSHQRVTLAGHGVGGQLCTCLLVFYESAQALKVKPSGEIFPKIRQPAFSGEVRGVAVSLDR